jgi:hypothetical protein
MFLASRILLMFIEPGIRLASNAHSPKAFTSLKLSPRFSFDFNSSVSISLIAEVGSFNLRNQALQRILNICLLIADVMYVS